MTNQSLIDTLSSGIKLMASIYRNHKDFKDIDNIEITLMAKHSVIRLRAELADAIEWGNYWKENYG